MTGRLTLTWANKERSVVADGEGGYLWVDPEDPRASEVRLLDDVSVVGDASDNLLVRGDSLHVLRALLKSPEYSQKFANKVKLVYIDPPFNTGQAFDHYDDAMEHSVWLGMIRDRLELIRDLLAPDGSVWVHLDDAEMAYAKVLMDEVFGRNNFVSTVIWEKADSPRNSARFLSTDQDYILVYAADASVWRPRKLPRSDAVNVKYKNPDNDPNGPWFGDNLRANKPYSLGRYTVVGPTGTEFLPPPGKFWRISQDRFDELNEQGRIWWGAKGTAFPTMKRYLSEVGDMVPRTLWLNTEVGSNRTSSNEMKKLFPGQESFNTPKPERLLERIIHIATDPGDIVVDVFAGSGTTAAVAHKMGRRWVTAELSESNADTFTAPRLTKVVEGTDSGGISNAVGWQGGGGFQQKRVRDAVFQPVDIDGLKSVVISPDTQGKTLARSVAVQLGFTPIMDDGPPFAGLKGRTRLAVLRGTADETSTSAVLSGLAEGQTVLIAATAVDPSAVALLKQHSKGSRIVRIPSSLFEKSRVIS